jgi:hypothetical protein
MLITRFKNWLINQKIFEHAYYRKSAIDSIRSLSGTILIHLLKIKYLKSERDIIHWKSEVKSYFRKINSIRIKPSNRKFSIDEYMEYLFIEPYCDSESSYKKDIYNPNLKYLESLIREINYDYNSNIKLGEIDFKLISTFFKDISESIANDNDFFVIVDNF